MKAKVAVVGFAVIASTVGFGALGGASAVTVSLPAPPAAASGVAVKVGNLVSVGQTGAVAGQSGGAASAKPVAIAGTPILSGTKATTKSGNGAILDTGEQALGRIMVGPWSTAVAPGQASSSAALAAAKLNGVGDVAVAPSSSLATWTPSRSSSSAVSDGAVLHLGDQTIKILHSESSANGVGKTYLVQILGHSIATTDSSGCMLDLGPVATVGCLTALSGVGADASVANALIGNKIPLGKVVSAVASGGVGTAASGPASVLGTDVSRSNNGLLARTGTNILTLFAFGLLLTVAGLVARRGSRQQLAMVPVKSRR
jgi:hypothetical protein